MSNGGRRGRRVLTEAERSLWRQVTESIRPLSPAPAPPPAVPAPTPAADAGSLPAPGAPTPAGAEPAPTTGAMRRVAGQEPKGLPDIDRRTRRRLARGSERIEARLDLHGLFQDEAHRRLRAFLAAAQASGLVHVLVITGKGRGADELGGRGVLRRSVPEWLRQPAFSRYVAGFGPAHHVHGGDGALYVRIRRGSP